MRDSFLKKLTHLAKSDKNVTLITADLGYGVFEKFEKNFPKQYLNVGVAEQAMTGIATGLALEGKKVFTYSIGNFPSLRCLEQIRNDAAYHEVNVNIVCSGGGFSYGQLGMSHHATEDLSILRSLPNITVCSPCTEYETEIITEKLSNIKGVGYLRLDKTQAPEDKSLLKEFEFGKMREFRKGDEITFIATGGILLEVLKAANQLGLEGINSRVLSCHSIKPLDSETIISSAKNTGGIITVEENNIFGGLGSAIAEVLLDNMIIPKKFLRLAINDSYTSIVGDQQFLRNYYKLDANSIYKNAINLIKN